MELPSGTPEEVGMSTEGLNGIDELMQKFVDDEVIQGAVVGIGRRGKVAYYEAHGFSDQDTRAPMQRDAMFQMASSTKPILGVAAMMMIEEGLFKLGDPVEKYIPEFKDIKVAVLKEPADEDISPEWVFKDIPEYRLVDVHRPLTIHDLLTHTSGLASSGLGSAVAKWKRGPEEILETWIPQVAAGPLDFQPGTRWAYSGTVGLDVVARIIEIVSGQRFNEFVQKRIFDPLDMKDTCWNLPKEKVSRLVVIRGDKKSWQKPTGYFSGSYLIISSARDYMRFEQMLVNGGILFGNRLISEESVALMSTNKVGDLYGNVDKGGKTKGVGFGYTVGITIDPLLANSPRGEGAFGWGGAAGTVSWSEPKRELTVVLMVQQPTQEVPDELAKAVSAAITD